MSEQNILNPTAGNDLSPDYGYTEGLPQMMSQFQARSGKVQARQLLARGRVFDLVWGSRLKTTVDALRQWEAQYRNDFFSYQDIERGRYFSGRFSGPLTISASGFNHYDIKGEFIEMPGLAMFAYPANWNGSAVQDSIFIEERDGFGNDLVKYTGAGWTVHAVKAQAHNGFWSFDATTNDYCEIVYFGYGFRYWSPKDNNLGIVEISLDGAVLGTVDLYAAATANSAALFTQTNTSLGFHRVKLRCTGTKNAASSNFFVTYDAIEVMQ